MIIRIMSAVLMVGIMRLAAAETLPPAVDVFQGGQGYPTFRIPALVVTTKGTLLALAEGRASMADQAHNTITAKRSTDGGQSWRDLQCLAADGQSSLNNPCAVVVAASGRILLQYQRYPQKFRESTVLEGYEGPGICRTFQISSGDDGQTWSTPVEITTQVKRPTARSTASGPGIGIELQHGQFAGRILMPFNQNNPHGVYAAYSTDQGQSWKYGDLAPAGTNGNGNEVQMVELDDGRVMLNARTIGGKGPSYRQVARSDDGGQTWSPLHNDPVLIESQCMASMIRYSFADQGGKSRILFANPASPKKREHGTLRLSYDEGQTWAISKEMVPGDFGYSSLAVLPDGTIGCLYECDNYKRISFLHLTLAWLTDGKDAPKTR